ncbi:MAG: hypothetical protein U1U88_001058 [Lawsonella clevelandensis]
MLLSFGSNDLRVQNQLVSDNAFPGTGPYLPHAEQSEVEQDLVEYCRTFVPWHPRQ